MCRPRSRTLCYRVGEFGRTGESSEPAGGANPAPSHDQIARLAYFYWQAGGSRPGTALEDWLRAERDLTGRRE